MLKRAPTVRSALAAGLTLAALAAAPAAAQTPPTAEAIWERFAGSCPAVVTAADPVTFATGIGDAEGAIGQSLDGRIRHSTVNLPDLDPDGGPAILMTQVNKFDGGRTIQCMLQVIGLDDSPAGLTDLMRAQAGRVLGEDAELASAGGPIVGIELGSGGGSPINGTEMLRISTEGFPPDAVMTVNVMPQVVILTLFVLQADGAE